nr:MAG TPA: hypothetical protein [Caudoviricetes sp.]
MYKSQSDSESRYSYKEGQPSFLLGKNPDFFEIIQRKRR